MRAILCAAAAALFTTASYAQERAPSVERIASLPSLTGTAPSAPRWSPDSEMVAFLWNDEGWPFRDVWIADAEKGAPKRLTDLAGKTPERRALRESETENVLLDPLTERLERRERGGVSDLVFGPDGGQVYFVFEGDLYRVAARGGKPKRLSEDGKGRGQLALSPDGSRLSYVQAGDLWLYDIATGEAARATSFGVPPIGSVAIGAFYAADVGVDFYHWSPDGSRIVFAWSDRREVRRVPFPSYLHDEPILHEARRPYPGDRDYVRRAGVLDIGSGETRFFEIDGANERDVLEAEWSPDGSRVLIHQDADIGENRWLYVGDPEAMTVRELYSDKRESRIYSMFEAEWSADGKEIYFINDRDRHYRLYAIPAEGGEARALTPDAYDIAGDVSVSKATGEILFVSTQKSPYERHLYRLSPEGGEAVRVTDMDGQNTPFLSSDAQRVALISSSDAAPAELYTDIVGADAPQRRITNSPLKEFYEYDWARPRYVSFPSARGDFEVHARIIEPQNLDPSKSYPVIIGNVYSNTVRNDWVTFRPIGLLQQHQVLTGDYIVAQVDLRGSVGYGVAFREAFQGDWGGGDLDDLEGLVRYLHTLPYVDRERIGVWGNSYGGMMTLFGLFKRPGMFAAGVAGAPAIDPHYFTGNDQHLSRRPETHPHIFSDSNLLLLGEDLEDPLLIIHSFHDDIVPLKTTIDMTEKLMLLGKDFELALVSNTGHWWAGREHYAVHTLRRLQNFLDEHVGPGARERGEANGKTAGE